MATSPLAARVGAQEKPAVVRKTHIWETHGNKNQEAQWWGQMVSWMDSVGSGGSQGVGGAFFLKHTYGEEEFRVQK